jgi:hypothetical protein
MSLIRQSGKQSTDARDPSFILQILLLHWKPFPKNTLTLFMSQHSVTSWNIRISKQVMLSVCLGPKKNKDHCHGAVWLT